MIKTLIHKILIMMALVSLMAGCDVLKADLSSSRTAAEAAAIGSAALASTNWYYNGMKGQNVSASIDNNLAIVFTQAAKVSDTGVKGSLKLSYTDSAGLPTSKTLDLNAVTGSFLADAKTYCLDMSPVCKFLDGIQVKDSTMDVTVSISGFVNADSGKAIPKLEKTFNLSPLFGVDPSILSFSTLYSTIGKKITLPLLGSAKLTNPVNFTIAAHGASTLPVGLVASDFAVTVTSDGKNLVITPKKDLLNITTYEMDLTLIDSLLPTGSAKPVSKTLTITFAPVLIFIDSILDGNWTDPAIATTATDASGDQMANWGTTNCDGTALRITNDTTYLYLSLSFSTIKDFWKGSSIVFMINKQGATVGAAVKADVDQNWWFNNNMSFANGNADIMLLHNHDIDDGQPSQGWLGVLKSGVGNDTTVAGDNWTSTPTNWSVAPSTLAGLISSNFIEYRIKLSTVGLVIGDTIKTFAVLNNGGSDPTDIIPGATPSWSGATLTTAVLDFNNALSYKLK